MSSSSSGPSNPNAEGSIRNIDPNDPLDLRLFCKNILSLKYPFISLEDCTAVLAADETLYSDLSEASRKQTGIDECLRKASTIFEAIRHSAPNPRPVPVAIPPEAAAQPQQTIFNRITAFVGALRPVFVDFINNNTEHVPKWCPPGGAADASWLEAQNFPSTGGKPDLLLHNLGSFAQSPDLLDRLTKIFEPQPQSHTFLVNTTGTGKTRSMLEGLCLHWGFYFASVVDTNNLGSYDLEKTIESYIPNSPGFIQDLSTTAGTTERMLSLEQNRRIASKRFTEVLLARVIIFQLFIEIIQQCRDVLEPKKLWLLIQINPWRLGYAGSDFFVDLTMALRDAPTEWVQDEISARLTQAREWCYSGFKRVPFFIVLDEAQHAARNHFSAFRSEQSHLIHRPVLREIVRAWLIDFFRHLGWWLIISGTGIDRDVIQQVMVSALMKPAAYRTQSNDGAFADSNSHATFMRQYIPQRVLMTPSGEALLERMSYWLHGRHRFTTAFLSELLSQCFRSPHRLLNSFVKAYTGITPTDGQRWIEKEPNDVQWPEALQLNSFDFSKLSQNPNMAGTIIRILNTDLVRSGLPTKVTVTEKLFVEYGFARYIETTTNKIVIDEPLVLLAAELKIGRSSWWYTDRIDTNTPKVNGLEDYLAFTLPVLFQTKPRLDEVFDFFGTIPVWSTYRVELVSVYDIGTGLGPDILPVLPNARPHFSYGTDPGADTYATVRWLQHRSPTFVLFPPKGMGPDLMFVLKVLDGSPQGSLLWVAMQAKYSEKGPRLDTETLAGAIRSTTPERYWIQKTGGQHKPKAHPGLAKGTLETLAQLPNRLADAGNQSVLRVIAACPAPASLNRATNWTEGFFQDKTGKHAIASLSRSFLAQATNTLDPIGKIVSMTSGFEDDTAVVPYEAEPEDEDDDSMDVDMPMAGPSKGPTPSGKKAPKTTKGGPAKAKSVKGSAAAKNAKGSAMGSVKSVSAPRRRTPRRRGEDVSMASSGRVSPSPSVASVRTYNLRNRSNPT
ncbi:hypothetical protein B0H16DRAFT_1544119 [Mycena metata]|uniref:Uncharacterized protein n=1 Tax=Mycena metata TaxID=1033252 RepID=A0AAD7J3W8_9AGAR|nr:hypothetical protein B0H16DRAFT_1544119 [Mycena metata]